MNRSSVIEFTRSTNTFVKSIIFVRQIFYALARYRFESKVKSKKHKEIF